MENSDKNNNNFKETLFSNESDKNNADKNKTSTENNHGNLNGSSGLSKAYTRRNKFCGKREENLEESLVLYDTLSKLCHLSLQKMSKGLTIILTGDSLSYQTMNISTEEIYKDNIEKLKIWFSSDEKRARVIRSFQE